MWAIALVLTLLHTSAIAKSQYFTDQPYILGELKLDSYVHMETNKVFRSLNLSNEKPSFSGKTTLSFVDLVSASFAGSSMRGNEDNGYADAFTELVFEATFSHNLRRSWQNATLGYTRYMYPNQPDQTYGELFAKYELNGYNLAPYVSYFHQMNETIKPATYSLAANQQIRIKRDNLEAGVVYTYDNSKIYANTGDWKDTGRYYKIGFSYNLYAYTLSFDAINTKDYNNNKKTYHVVRFAYASDAKLNFTGFFD